MPSRRRGSCATCLPLPSDNGLPRWLEEVRRIPGSRAAAVATDWRIDLDTPLDLALLSGASRRPRRHPATGQHDRAASAAASCAHWRPMPTASCSSRAGPVPGTLGWLERHIRCRVRALVEERGLKASSGASRPPALRARPAAGGSRTRSARRHRGAAGGRSRHRQPRAARPSSGRGRARRGHRPRIGSLRTCCSPMASAIPGSGH